MKLKVIIHPAEEGGFWAEAPAIAGCVIQGETMEEILTNFYEALEVCLCRCRKNCSAENDRVFEIAV